MATARIASYDIFRGLLIAGMVVFHILANLTPLQFNQRLFYVIPVAFSFSLGIVLGQFLVHRTAKKLSLAAKLLAVFLIGNIPYFISPNFSFGALLAGDQTVLSFEVLWSMTGLLLAAVLFDYVAKYKKTLLAVFCAAVLLLHYFGIYFYSLSFLLYGLIGYALALNIHVHEFAVQESKWPRIIWWTGLAIIPLLLTQFVGFYDFLIVLQALALYVLSVRVFKRSPVLKFLGHHSFVIYVAHIIVIKLIVVLIS